jgi:tellurite resistance protein TerC
MTLHLPSATSLAAFADLDVAWWHWAGLLGLVAVLLAVDLLLHRDDHEPTLRSAAVESTVWVACGVGFAFVVLALWGATAFGEYLSGYVIEKSLSVDNVFVWAVIFSSFAIPARYQHRVLFWGIFGALALRAVFIVGGAALIERFWWLLPVFGALLVWSGLKVVRHQDDEGTHGHDRAVKLLGRFLPVRSELDGRHLLVREEVGTGAAKTGATKTLRWVATHLLAALVVVEVTDVIFAVDSVPAVLAVSREPFIVFASNAFAILGLRALYFLLGGAKERFHYLAHALGAILVFVGLKMVVSHWWHLPTPISLGVIVLILGAAVVASEVKRRRVERRVEASATRGRGN